MSCLTRTRLRARLRARLWGKYLSKEGIRLWEAMSDERLLRACRDGDTDAFAVLWERHRRAGFVAARNLAPSLDPDDLVSDAYLKIFELVREGRGPQETFRPYLYQVIRSVAADRFRAGEHATVELTDAPELHEAAPWEDNAFDLNAVADAFAKLTPRWQAALWYTEVEGLPPREAALFLGLSANSTSALAARARDALRSGWVEAHIDRELADGACQFTLEHLQRFQRGKLTSRLAREVESHLGGCASCTKAAAESTTLNRQLGLVLAWLSLGGVGTALLAEQLGLSQQLGVAGAAAGAASLGGAGGGSGGAGGGASGVAAGTSGAAASTTGGLVASIGMPAIVTTGSGLLAAAVIGVTVVSLTLTGASPAPPKNSPVGVAESTVTADDSGDGSTDETERQPKPDAKSADDTAPARETEPTAPKHTPPEPGQAGPAAPNPLPTDEGPALPPTEGPGTPPVNPPVRPPVEPPVKPPVDPPVTPPVTPPVKPPVKPEEPGDPALRVGYQCMLPGFGLIGSANRYGVIQLRGSVDGKVPVEIKDPAFDPGLEGQPGNVFSNGVYNDGRGNTFGVGFITRTGNNPLPLWQASDPSFLPAWELLFPGAELGDVALEMRLVTPDKRSSPWQSIDASRHCIP